MQNEETLFKVTPRSHIRIRMKLFTGFKSVEGIAVKGQIVLEKVV